MHQPRQLRTLRANCAQEITYTQHVSVIIGLPGIPRSYVCGAMKDHFSMLDEAAEHILVAQVTHHEITEVPQGRAKLTGVPDQQSDGPTRISKPLRQAPANKPCGSGYHGERF